MTSNFPGCHWTTIQPSSRGPMETPKHRLPPFRPTPAMPPRPTTVRWSARHSPRPRAGEGRRRLNEITGQVSVAGARVCLHLNSQHPQICPMHSPKATHISGPKGYLRRLLCFQISNTSRKSRPARLVLPDWSEHGLFLGPCFGACLLKRPRSSTLREMFRASWLSFWWNPGLLGSSSMTISSSPRCHLELFIDKTIASDRVFSSRT